MKTLVVYFSATGTTRKQAEKIAKEQGADLYEIKPVIPYTKADLNWMDKQSRSSVEMADKTFRPEIVDDDAHIADYDVIWVGFPIWWYTAPTIINTFFETFDLRGKKIVLFATSGGSGIQRAVSDLSAAYPELGIRGGELLNRRVKEDIMK